MKTSSDTQPNILLIDDNRDGLLVRRSLLEEVGYCVQIARNGEEGLKLFETSEFAVVVTDYKMPRMDGKELIERIRKIDPKARVILLSGFAEPMGLTAENTGADVVLAKNGSEPVHLVRSVKRLVNRATRKPPASQRAERLRGRAVVR